MSTASTWMANSIKQVLGPFLTELDKRYALKGSGGVSSGLAGWYELNLPTSPINIGDSTSPQDYMVNLLQIQPVQTYGNYQSQYVKQRYAVLSVPRQPWVLNDETGKYEMVTTVRITWGDGSYLEQPMSFITNQTITYYTPGVKWAAKMAGGYLYEEYSNKGYINTGLTLNGSYIYRVCGFVPFNNSAMGVLVGAQNSQSARNTCKIMTGSNKAQMQWSANSELTAATSGVSFRTLFHYEQSASAFKIQAGSQEDPIGSEYSTTNSSWRTTDVYSTTPILLFDETTSGNSGSNKGCYRNGVIRWASISNSENNTLRCFVPAALQSGEMVFLDIYNSLGYNNGENLQYLADVNTAIENGDFDDGGQYESNVYRPIGSLLVPYSETDYNDYLATL